MKITTEMITKMEKDIEHYIKNKFGIVFTAFLFRRDEGIVLIMAAMGIVQSSSWLNHNIDQIAGIVGKATGLNWTRDGEIWKLVGEAND